MTRRLSRWRWLVPVVMAGAMAGALALPGFGQVQAPAVAQATASAQGQCVAPPAVMRRTHPDLLRHERSLTVHDGIRDAKSRLENCVTCHAVRDAAGAPVSFPDPRHFCQSCHVQAAVSIDCFSCHRSTPATPVAAAGKS